MDELEARIADLSAREQLDAMRPELDGDAVMARLGVAPGRVVGEALVFLLDLRLDEGVLGVDEAGRRLDEWWAARGDGPGYQH
jgi:poly(A) polymerase